MRQVRALVVGFGSVGRSLVRLLVERHDILVRKLGLDIKVVGIGDSSGFAISKDFLSRDDLLKLLECPRGHVVKCGVGGACTDYHEAIHEIDPDVVVEMTPANYETGEPGLTYIRIAIEHGINVVTSNKAPLVLRFDELMSAARRKGVRIGYRGTVMAGVPVIDVLRKLVGQDVRSVKGILNATTNYILTKVFRDGLSVRDAFEEARRLGIMEKDPRLDLEGVDAAAKIVIIANSIGLSMRLNDVRRRGIGGLSQEEVERVRGEGKVLKLIAELDVERRTASVEPRALDLRHDLASVDYTLNAVLIETDTNSILIKGKGGGGMETASNVLSDMIEVSTGCA